MGRRVLGIILFVVGVLLAFLLQIPITGNVIAENLGDFRYILSAVLIIFGIVLMAHPLTLEERVVSHGEREQIKSAFRQWDGKLTGAQKKVLSRYGLRTETTGGGHVAFYFPYSQTKVYTSSTPSDQRTGLNFALKQLIPYIEGNYMEHVA